MTASPSLVDFFLPEAARTIAAADWVFTGFNWPVLATRVARRIAIGGFVQVLEGGAALDQDTPELLNSTTDYQRYGGAMCFRGSLGDVLLNLVSRCDLVVIDAANVDVHGRTNSTAIGPMERPRVRLPGGGGGPDAAGRARHVVLLHGGSDPERIQQRVEHVTAAPSSAATVQLITRWGVIRLGDAPRLECCLDGADDFRARLDELGVDVRDAEPAPSATAVEREACLAVLAEAAAAGYGSATEALAGAAR